MIRVSIWIAFILLGTDSACQAQAPAPKGDRRLGMHVNMSENRDYGHAFNLARNAGTEVVTLHLNWDDLEKSPGMLDNEYLRLAEFFYPASGVKLHLSLNPVDTNRMRLPRDLEKKRLNTPEVIERFKKALDYVFETVPNVTLQSLALGNEVDAAFGAKEESWKDYLEFFKAAREHVRTKRPKVPVGVALQFSTLAGPVPNPARRMARELAMVGDAAMVTYYPLNPDFSVRFPGSVSGDLQALFEALPGKPVFLVEAGYPSSDLLRSSPEKQKTFIEGLFRAWDRFKDRVPLICISWLHDITEASVNEFTQYYGTSSRNFRAYLGTLGLRTGRGSGEDKPAFTALVKEAKARGW